MCRLNSFPRLMLAQTNTHKKIQVVGDCASQSGVKQIRLIVVAFIFRKKGSAKRTREARLFLEAYFFLARLQSFKLREITHKTTHTHTRQTLLRRNLSQGYLILTLQKERETNTKTVLNKQTQKKLQNIFHETTIWR